MFQQKKGIYEMNQNSPGTKQPQEETERLPRADPKHPQNRPGRAPQQPPGSGKVAHSRTRGAGPLVDCFA